LAGKTPSQLALARGYYDFHDYLVSCVRPTFSYNAPLRNVGPQSNYDHPPSSPPVVQRDDSDDDYQLEQKLSLQKAKIDSLKLENDKLQRELYRTTTSMRKNNSNIAEDDSKLEIMSIPELDVYERELRAKLSKITIIKARKTEEVENRKFCVVCLDKHRRWILIPCGHYALCAECINQFKEGDHCPVCRSIVVHKYRVFL